MLNKYLIFLLIIILLVIPVFAQEPNVNFLKDKYLSGESVQVEIDFNNLTLVNPFSYNNIKLYDEDSKIPLNLNLYKLEDKYFLYFILPNLEEKDYNFVIEDILYSYKGVLKKESFIYNLSVIHGKGVSVNPALIYLNVEPWVNPKVSLELKNNLDEDVIIGFDVPSENIVFNKEDLTLKNNQRYLLSLVLTMRDYKEDKFNSEIQINYLNTSIKIPVIINKISKNVLSSGGEVIEPIQKGDIVFNEEFDKIERVLRKEDIVQGSLNFKNTGDKIFRDLKFELSGNLNEIIRIEYKGDYVLDGLEEENINIYVNEKKAISKNYTGNLIIRSEDYNIEFPIFVYFKPEEISLDNESLQPDYSYDYTIEYYNYTEELPAPEKKSNFLIYFIFGVFLIVFLALIRFFYIRGKPKKKEEEFSSLLKR